jgi:hypothetical protein
MTLNCRENRAIQKINLKERLAAKNCVENSTASEEYSAHFIVQQHLSFNDVKYKGGLARFLPYETHQQLIVSKFP